uniref:Endonuclease/exonuclease/phosphatase domain-containing protein n=1 Tax=Tetranychus urticae TaxID=32264 RepID=T1KVZ9_TETUR
MFRGQDHSRSFLIIVAAMLEVNLTENIADSAVILCDQCFLRYRNSSYQTSKFLSPCETTSFKDIMDRQAQANSIGRGIEAWKYDFQVNLLTCFMQNDFSFLQTFATGCADFLVAVVQSGDKRIGVINCHQSYAFPNVEEYLFELFSAIHAPVDGLVLAGDLNLKNV